MSTATTAMASTTLRKRATNGSSEANVTSEGRKTDKLLDSHTRYCKTHYGTLFLLSPFFLTTAHFGFLYQVGVRRAMGRHCHDDRIPDAHVLSVDMSLVL